MLQFLSERRVRGGELVEEHDGFHHRFERISDRLGLPLGHFTQHLSTLEKVDTVLMPVERCDPLRPLVLLRDPRNPGLRVQTESIDGFPERTGLPHVAVHRERLELAGRLGRSLFPRLEIPELLQLVELRQFSTVGFRVEVAGGDGGNVGQLVVEGVEGG